VFQITDGTDSIQLNQLNSMTQDSFWEADSCSNWSRNYSPLTRPISSLLHSKHFIIPYSIHSLYPIPPIFSYTRAHACTHINIHTSTLFKIQFNFILPSTSRFHKWFLSLYICIPHHTPCILHYQPPCSPQFDGHNKIWQLNVSKKSPKKDNVWQLK
jgi:hypothetical protein